MSYQPNPPELSGIKLPPELQNDMEMIAQAVHDSWALERQKGGWKYGDVLDRENKTHPSMREYESLPEAEKELDRVTIRQTIKMLLWLGYRIER